MIEYIKERIHIIIACIFLAFFAFFVFPIFIHEKLIIDLFRIIVFVIIFFWFLIDKLIENAKIKKREEIFSSFLNDLAQNVRGGMSVPVALRNLRNNDYGELSLLVKKLSSQVDLGIPFDKALIRFAEKTKSGLIKRSCLVIIESLKAGGDVASTVEAIARSSVEVERLRAERKLMLSGTVTEGYIIYFVFLAIVLALSKFLIPQLLQAQKELKLSLDEINSLMQHLIIIQSLFSGLLIGKMVEGSTIAGLRHSAIMIFIGLIVFTLGSYLF